MDHLHYNFNQNWERGFFHILSSFVFENKIIVFLMYFLLYFKSIVFFLARAEGGVPDCFIFRLMLCVSDPLSLQFCYSFEKMA